MSVHARTQEVCPDMSAAEDPLVSALRGWSHEQSQVMTALLGALAALPTASSMLQKSYQCIAEDAARRMHCMQQNLQWFYDRPDFVNAFGGSTSRQYESWERLLGRVERRMKPFIELRNLGLRYANENEQDIKGIEVSSLMEAWLERALWWAAESARSDSVIEIRWFAYETDARLEVTMMPRSSMKDAPTKAMLIDTDRSLQAFALDILAQSMTASLDVVWRPYTAPKQTYTQILHQESWPQSLGWSLVIPTRSRSSY